MSKQGQIEIRADADIADAARKFRETKQATQEMADALGLTVTEYRKLEREMRKKAQADKQVTASTNQNAAATRSQAAAATASATASRAAAGALSAMGVAAHGALGPLGLVVGLATAIGGATAGAAGSMSAYVDKVGLASEKTGVSTAQYIALSRAIRAAGGDVGTLDTALSQFVRKQNLVGKSASEVDAALRAEIARIEAIPGPADRAAARMESFGTKSAAAVAALSSEGIRRAQSETAALASDVERAAASSAAMDEAGARLSDSMTRLTVVFGDRLAPAVVKSTDALAGMIDNAVTLTQRAPELTGALMSVAFPLPGLIANMTAYAGATSDYARQTSSFNSMMNERANRLKRVADEAKRGADIMREFGLDAPVDTSGLGYQRAATPEEQAAAKAAAARARAQAEEVARARKAVADQFRRDEFAAEVADGVERERAAIEGARREAELIADEAAARDAAHAERMRQLAEEQAMQRQTIELRREVLTSAASGLAQLVEASSASAEAIATARILETTAYGAVAFARALAELGPLAGLPVAISTGAAIGAQIAAVKAAPSRHMGSMAPDEGLLKVRNGERVTVEPATTSGRRRDRDPASSGVAVFTIDNQAYRAMVARSGRQDTIFGARRRDARSTA